MYLICNGTVDVVKSSSVKIKSYKTKHMARFDVKFPPESAARKYKVALLQNDYERQLGRVQNFTSDYPTINQFADQFQQLCSKFQSIAAIIDLGRLRSHC